MVQAKGKGNAGRGKIIDKNKRKDTRAEGRSEVVCLRGTIDGHRDLEDGELMQKVGDEYKRFGRVVQIVVRWDEVGDKGRVFVLFADEGCAQMVCSPLLWDHSVV